MAISANQQMILQKQEDWNDMMEAWIDDLAAASPHGYEYAPKPKKKGSWTKRQQSQSTPGLGAMRTYTGGGRVDLRL